VGKAGLNVRSLDEVLQLPDNQIDLATAALIASEYWSDVVPGRHYLDVLDEMAWEIRRRLRERRMRMTYRAIPVINDYLFNELGFKTISHADDPNDLFLHSVLDRRQGYCLSLSVLYLALAERLGLDLYGVVVPGHFFVRFDNGSTRFNIETTNHGANPSDEHYMAKFNVPVGGRQTIYMKNLSKRQTLGCFFNNLGNVYSDLGDVDTAKRALERAVAINPALSESRANLGNIYLEQSLVDQAIEQYEAALRLNPNDPKTYNNLGNALMDLNLLEDAAVAYRHSLELDPNFVDAYRNAALVYTRRQHYRKALTHLTHATELAPRDARIRSQLADVHFRMGNCDEAILQFRQALSLKHDFAEAYYGLGLCYRELGQVTQEIQAYGRALNLKPDLLPALVNLGNAHFNRADYGSAVSYYSRAAAVKPDDAWILFNLGAAYSNQQDFERAVDAYRQAVKLDPGIGDAHHGLAYGYYHLHQYALAWKHINIARKLGVEVTEEQVKAIRSRLN
jgi:tetratricopeptide (TPR) repeat protein